MKNVLVILALIAAALAGFGCKTPPAPLPEPAPRTEPVDAGPAFGAGVAGVANAGTHVDKAGAHTDRAATEVQGMKQAAPAVADVQTKGDAALKELTSAKSELAAAKGELQAVKDAGTVLKAQFEEANTRGNTAEASAAKWQALGEDERKRREEAEKKLNDEARQRIINWLTVFGFILWALAAIIGLKDRILSAVPVLGQVSTVTNVLGAVSSPKSFMRKWGAVVLLLFAGGCCFYAAIHFDDIMLIIKWGIGIIAAGATTIFAIHHLKHRAAENRAQGFERRAAASSEFGTKGGLDYTNPDLLKRAALELDAVAFSKFEAKVNSILRPVR